MKFIKRLFGTGGPLFAEAIHTAKTGMELRDECQWVVTDASQLTEEQRLKGAVCLSYILGVSEGCYLRGRNPHSTCVPNDQGITNGQLGIVVFKYLEDHPEDLHMHSGILVIRALKKAFACK